MTDSAGPGEAEQGLEIELKLSGPQGDLESAWGRGPAGTSREAVKHLVSTYFDTSDRRLRRKGLTLRVRRDGERYTQTVKATGSSFPVDGGRQEWSVPIPGPEPDTALIEDSGLVERVGLVLPSELEPLFTTDVRRRTRRYQSAGPDRIGAPVSTSGRIEAALDQGVIAANGKSEPISEIEFELLEGSPLALYREAAKFHRATPLRLEPRSKADRGFALAFGESPVWSKASKGQLEPGITLEVALGRIFRDCAKHWLANHAAVLDGGDPEALHQMRVALRRLRSALSVFRSVLPARDLDWLQREAKALLSGLGPARDWDVFCAELLAPVRAAQPGDPNLEVLRSIAQDRRRHACADVRALLTSPRYTAYALDLGAWVDGRGWVGPEAEAALAKPLVEHSGGLLRKRHRRTLKLGRDFESLSDDALHRVRISLKKLRYTAEFFASLYPAGRTKPYLESLRRLQNDLGFLNDLAMAQRQMTELRAMPGDNSGALAIAAGVVIGWYARGLSEVRPRIAEDWHSFVDAKVFWRDSTAKKPKAGRTKALGK